MFYFSIFFIQRSLKKIIFFKNLAIALMAKQSAVLLQKREKYCLQKKAKHTIFSANLIFKH